MQNIGDFNVFVMLVQLGGLHCSLSESQLSDNSDNKSKSLDMLLENLDMLDSLDMLFLL